MVELRRLDESVRYIFGNLLKYLWKDARKTEYNEGTFFKYTEFIELHSGINDNYYSDYNKVN